MIAPLRIASLDLSLTATGIAVTHDGHGHPRLACRTITPIKRRSATAIDHQRMQQIIAAVQAAVRNRPDLVVIEWLPQFTGHGDATLRLAELHGLVKHWLWSRGITYVDVKPTYLQMYATGKGKATKDEVLKAVIARYGRFLHIHTYDEADAVALLASALHHYGQPLVGVQSHHVQALEGTTWPDLTGGTR